MLHHIFSETPGICERKLAFKTCLFFNLFFLNNMPSCHWGYPEVIHTWALFQPTVPSPISLDFVSQAACGTPSWKLVLLTHENIGVSLYSSWVSSITLLLSECKKGSRSGIGIAGSNPNISSILRVIVFLSSLNFSRCSFWNHGLSARGSWGLWTLGL